MKFSVLMSVYYKEQPEYLNLSLESVFNQTIIPNEVVLVEDGTLTKELDKVITKYQNKYPEILKVVKFKDNRGLGVALHDGVLECSNDIIFRMDTDDICISDRFEKQLNIFATKDIDVVGSNIDEYDDDMKEQTGKRIVAETNEEIIKMAKKRNPINHMTVAFKKEKMLEAGNYQDMPYFEDYYLWARMIKNNCKFYNIQESLVNVRGGKEMIKRRGGKKYVKPIINFEKSLLTLKLINPLEYMFNTSSRVIISLIPNSLRSLTYKLALRK